MSANLRVKMAPPEFVGGPGTRQAEMIPLLLEDSITHDVVAYIPHAVHVVRKERAVLLVSAINAIVDAKSEEPVPAVAAAAHEKAISVSDIEAAIGRGDHVNIAPDGKCTISPAAGPDVHDEVRILRKSNGSLAAGVLLAIAKLHDIIMARGTPLNPVVALGQLEDCMRMAGMEPPARPEGFNDAAQLQEKQWPGHPPIPPTYAGDERRTWPSKGIMHRQPEDAPWDGKVRAGDVYASPGEQRAATETHKERRQHEPGMGVEFRDDDTKAPVREGDKQTVVSGENGYKPRDDAAG